MTVDTLRMTLAEDFIDKWERGQVTDSQFGSELRKLRRRMRVTIEKLAGVSELTMATISNVERSVRPPRIDTIEKLFRGLQLIERQREDERMAP